MAAGLKSHIWDNNLRSVLMLVLYPLVLTAMLWAGGLAVALLGGTPGANPPQLANAIVLEYWPVMAAIVAIWFTVAWFFHAGMIRMVSHAHPVTRADEPALYNMLENLCISRGITMPRLEIIESHARNAFASGISDKTYAITLTRGLLQALQPDEVEGVMAHELTHIINRDVRLLMVCVIFTGMIGFAAQMMWSNLRYSLWMPRSSTGNGRRNNPFVLYFAILAILAIGYMASMLARFGLSRAREYMADAGAVELTRNPEAMMRALMRISGRDRIPGSTDDIALMCIENSAPFMGLFATHPPIAARIKILSETTLTPIPELPPHAPAAYQDRFQKPDENAPEWLIRTRQGKMRNPWQ